MLSDRGILARDLLEALPVAVYVTDAAGLLTFYNRAAADLWGWRPDLGSTRWCGSWRLFWTDGTPLPHDQCPMAVAIQQNRQVRERLGTGCCRRDIHAELLAAAIA